MKHLEIIFLSFYAIGFPSMKLGMVSRVRVKRGGSHSASFPDKNHPWQFVLNYDKWGNGKILWITNNIILNLKDYIPLVDKSNNEGNFIRKSFEIISQFNDLKN